MSAVMSSNRFGTPDQIEVLRHLEPLVREQIELHKDSRKLWFPNDLVCADEHAGEETEAELLRVRDAARGIPDTVRSSFRAGGVVLFAAVLWTVLTTREYAPDELARFGAQDAVAAPSSASLADRGLGHGLAWIAAGVATIFIVKGFATYLQGLLLSRAGNAIIAERQRRLYDRVLSHGIEFYQSYSSSDLITRLTQSANAARSVVDLLVTSYVRDLFTLISLVIVMVAQQPVMSLVAAIFGPGTNIPKAAAEILRLIHRRAQAAE